MASPAKEKNYIPTPSLLVGKGIDTEPLPKRRKVKAKKELDDFPDLHSLPEYPAPARQRRSQALSRPVENPPPGLGCHMAPGNGISLHLVL